MAYKITNKRPKTKGNGLVIIDDLNYQVWRDTRTPKQEKKLFSLIREGKNKESDKLTDKIIKDEKRNLGSYQKTKNAGKQLAKKYNISAFDRGTRKYITPKSAFIKK